MSYIKPSRMAKYGAPPLTFSDFRNETFWFRGYSLRWDILFGSDGRLRFLSNLPAGPTEAWVRDHISIVTFRPLLFPDPVTRELIVECDVASLNMGVTDASSASTDSQGVGLAVIGNEAAELQMIGRNGFVNANPRMTRMYWAHIDDTAATQNQDTADRAGAKWTIRYRLFDDRNGASPFGRKFDRLLSINGGGFVEWRDEQLGYQYMIMLRGYRFGLVAAAKGRMLPAFEATVLAFRVLQGLVYFP